MGDLGLYLHIPFCKRKCNYCDFYVIKNIELIDRFATNLKKELELNSKNHSDEEIVTIFIGGGTPSILKPSYIKEILNKIRQLYNINNVEEITIETNPEDFFNTDNKIDIDKINIYKDSGINRISIGVQSFIYEELKLLTRNHDPETSIRIIEELKNHFKNISIDLIYSIPGQTLKDWEINLDITTELEIPHVSAYTLIFEKETILYKDFLNGKIKQNSHDLEAEMYSLTFDKLVKKNFAMYEVSNFAKPGFESIHNQRYWNYDDYLGIGPSAHSFYDKKRWNNSRNIIKYNKMIESGILPIENETHLNVHKQKTEFIMLSLRSLGIDNVKYKKLFNTDFFIDYDSSIKDLIHQGLAFRYSDHLKLTGKGYLLADEIMVNYF
jgi:oxygen-independent coproporphyrinogen-3 oxidase